MSLYIFHVTHKRGLTEVCTVVADSFGSAWAKVKSDSRRQRSTLGDIQTAKVQCPERFGDARFYPVDDARKLDRSKPGMGLFVCAEAANAN